MVTLLTIVHITVCLFLILVVLLQAGKGGGMGIAFGGAGSQTVFGSSGAGNFLTRLTSITATIFLLTSLALAHYSSRQDSKRLQQLAAEKAAEKKSDDEKAAKLKADMEKMRAASPVSKDGGAAGVTPPSPATSPAAPPASPASDPLTRPPLQLKMPGSLGKPGATGTEPAGPSGAAAEPASEGVPVPAKPLVRRRKLPSASTASPLPDSDSGPAPTAPLPAHDPAPQTAPPPPAE